MSGVLDFEITAIFAINVPKNLNNDTHVDY